MFHAVKPGLSEYKDNPEEVCKSVHLIFRELLTTKPLGFSLGWVHVMQGFLFYHTHILVSLQIKK